MISGLAVALQNLYHDNRWTFVEKYITKYFNDAGYAGRHPSQPTVLIVATHAGIGSATQCVRNQDTGEYESYDANMLLQTMLHKFDASLYILPHVYAVDGQHAGAPEMKSLKNTLGELKTIICQVCGNAKIRGRGWFKIWINCSL